MADNWLHHFVDMAERKKMNKHIPKQLSAIQQDLDNHRLWLQPTTNGERYIHSGFLKMTHLTEQEGFRMAHMSASPLIMIVYIMASVPKSILVVTGGWGEKQSTGRRSL